MQYTGRRYRCEPLLAGRRFSRPFGLDVAFAEPLVGKPEFLRGTDFFEFAGIPRTEYRVYPPETHIAEKLHAYTLPRSRPNSRVKDLPDLALLALVRNFDSEVLRSAIQQTFAHRGTHPVPVTIPAPPREWGPVYERLATTDNLQWKDLGALLKAVREFLDPILSAGSGTWNPERCLGGLILPFGESSIPAPYPPPFDSLRKVSPSPGETFLHSLRAGRSVPVMSVGKRVEGHEAVSEFATKVRTRSQA